jgi:PAS domain S-box-containing protein
LKSIRCSTKTIEYTTHASTANHQKNQPVYNVDRSASHPMNDPDKKTNINIQLQRPGVLTFHGMRAALLDLEAGYWNLRARLEALIGQRLTDTALQQTGVSAGMSMARAIQPAGSPEDIFRDCLAAYQASGFGCFTIEQFNEQSGRAQVRAVDTADAWLAARHTKISATSTCHYTAGFLVGVMQAAAVRNDMVCIETNCQARGDASCQFELIPAEQAAGRPAISGQTDPTISSELNLLEILFERTPLGIAFFDRECRLMRCNPTWAHFIEQYTPTSAPQVLPGKSFYELAPGSEESTRPLFERVLGGENIRIDSLPVTSAGVTSYWDTILVPLVEDQGIVGFLDLTIDASQREAALRDLEHTLAALRERDERFKLVMNATNDGIWDWNLATGEVYYSPRWKNMLGYAEDEIEGRFESWRDLVHPDDLQDATAAIDAYLAGDKPAFEHEHRLRAKDGSYRLILTRGIAVRDQNGKPMRLAGSHTDVTDRARAEQALKESEANHRALLETAHSFAVYRLALDPTAPYGARVLMVSPSIREIAGIEDPYDFDQWFHNIHPNDQERIRAANQRSMQSREPYDEIARFFHPIKQKWVYIHTVSHPTQNADGETTHYNGLVIDATEQKEAEAQLQYKIQFENLITHISTQFIDLPPEKIDDGIQQALQSVGEFAGVDRSYVFLFSDDYQTLRNTHEWCAQGIEPQIQNLQEVPVERLKWSNDQILAGKILHIPDVDNLPEEAANEKLEFSSQGIKSLVAVPLAYQGKVIGLLGFDSVMHAKTWRDDNLILLTMIGEFFVNALEHKRSQAIQAGQRQFLELLATEGTFSETLDSLVHIIEEQSPGMIGLILLLDPDGLHLHIGSGPNLPKDYLDTIEGLAIGPMVGSCGTASYLKQRVIVEDIDTDPRWDGLRDLAQKYDLRACWSEPVFSSDGTVIGTFAMYYRYPRSPNKTELHTIQVAAHLAGVAIEHKRAQEDLRRAYQTLEQRVQERTRQLTTLVEVSQNITSTLNLEPLLGVILEQLRQVLDYTGAAIMTIEDGPMVVQAYRGPAAQLDVIQKRFPEDDFVNNEVIRRQEAVILNDVQNEGGLAEHFRRSLEINSPGLFNYIRSWMGIPLTIQERAIGILTLDHRQPGHYRPEHGQLALAFANYAAVAIENARLYRTEHNRRAELEALYRADEELYRHLNLDEVLEALVDVAVDILKGDKSSLMVWDKEQMSVKAARGFRPETLSKMHFSAQDGMVGRVVRTGSPIYVNDTYTHPDVDRRITDVEGIRSFIHVPIKVGGKIFGVFNVDYLEPRSFSEEDQRLITALAQRAAIAIENAHLYQAEQSRQKELAELYAETRRRADEVQTLFAVQQAITRRLDPDAVLQMIADEARRLTDTSMSSVYLLEGEDLVISVVSGDVSSKMLGFRVPVNNSVAGMALNSGRPFRVTDANREEKVYKALTKQVGAESFLIVPLLSSDRPLGTITVANKSTGQIGDQDERVLTLLASSVVVALENARLYHEEQSRRIETERRRQVAEGLRNILDVLNSNRPIDEIIKYAVIQASDLIGSDAAMLRHGDIAAGAVTTVASHNIPSEFDAIKVTRLYTSESDKRLMSRQPIIVPDIHTANQKLLMESQIDEIQRAGTEAEMKYFRSLLGVPIFIGDEIYGALRFYFKNPHEFTQEDIHLATSLGDQVALAIENARLRAQAQEHAAAAERSRLARDLHDAVTQTLFSASLIAEVLPRIWERKPEEGQRRLEELRQLTRGALAEMRALLLELRPSALMEAEIEDLFRQLSEAFTGRSRLPVSLKIEGKCQVPADIRIALYRIAQEAMNNIAKHAHASQVELELTCAEHELKLCIQDDGTGFSMEHISSDHLGLGIMKERAEAIGAVLTITSQPGKGTRIEAAWKEQEMERRTHE